MKDIKVGPDPFLKEGDNILDEIIKDFLYKKGSLENAQRLALKYAEHQRQYALIRDMNEYDNIDYSTWFIAITESRKGNWENLAAKIEFDGIHIKYCEGLKQEDEDAAQALITLAGSL